MKQLEELIDRESCLVIDSSFRPFKIEDWTDSISDVVSGTATILIPRSGDLKIRSQNLVLPWPLVVQRNQSIPEHYKEYKPEDIVSKKIVLLRDGKTCLYCGAHGTTVDHIFPKARGGTLTWGNTATACFVCNNNKDCRTPQEAGMRIPKIPKKMARKRFAEYEAAVIARLESMI